MKKKIVFYAFADSIKAKIVFNQIKLNRRFDKYDKILITDNKFNNFDIKFKKIINYSDLSNITLRQMIKYRIYNFLTEYIGYKKKYLPYKRV